jgi:hypothetical protein
LEKKKIKKIFFLFSCTPKFEKELTPYVRNFIVLGQAARYGVSVSCGGDGINCDVNAKSETERSQNL